MSQQVFKDGVIGWYKWSNNTWHAFIENHPRNYVNKRGKKVIYAACETVALASDDPIEFTTKPHGRVCEACRKAVGLKFAYGFGQGFTR